MDAGPWIQTASGRAFHYLAPRLEDIELADIATGLSNTCRFAGQLADHYSVADHSVFVSQQVPAEHALQALLHDATEAYLCDIPTPLKRLIAGYRNLEHLAWTAIAERFGVPVELHPCVKAADEAVLRAEQSMFFPKLVRPWGLPEGPTPDIRMPKLTLPKHARVRFLERFTELSPGGSHVA